MNEEKKRPTVGDKVRITDRSSGYFDHIGEIVEDDETSIPYRVEFEDEEQVWYYEEDVELVESTTTTTTSIIAEIHEISLVLYGVDFDKAEHAIATASWIEQNVNLDTAMRYLRQAKEDAANG